MLLSELGMYIDPGTGSMLLTIIITISGALVFAIRGLFLKLRFIASGGRAKADAQDAAQVVLFSDAPTYWTTFEPVLDELERRGIEAQYWTRGGAEPALAKEYSHIRILDIGTGNAGWAKLNVMDAKLCIATTPNLGVYFWKRSANVKRYVHIFHAVDNGSLYRMFALDHYDAIWGANPAAESFARFIESQRPIKRRDFKCVGLPYLDALQQKVRAFEGDAPSHPCILLAPSWGSQSLLSKYGSQLLASLRDTGYHIIVRPHPQSFISEKEAMERLMSEFPEGEHFQWDIGTDNVGALSKSDILISDFSGIIADYALVFGKPVLFSVDGFDESQYDSCWEEGEPWLFSVLDKVGRRFDAGSLDGLKDLLDDMMESKSDSKARSVASREAWWHRGDSAKRIADAIECELAALDGGAALLDEPAGGAGYPPYVVGGRVMDLPVIELDEDGM